MAPELPIDLEKDLEFESINFSIRTLISNRAPRDIRIMSAFLYAIENLPKTTRGVNITMGWRTKSLKGNWQWADMTINETSITATIGEHAYDPDFGGDTVSEQIFYADIKGRRSGSLSTWWSQAQELDEIGYFEIRDENISEDYIEWDN